MHSAAGAAIYFAINAQEGLYLHNENNASANRLLPILFFHSEKKSWAGRDKA